MTMQINIFINYSVYINWKIFVCGNFNVLTCMFMKGYIIGSQLNFITRWAPSKWSINNDLFILCQSRHGCCMDAVREYLWHSLMRASQVQHFMRNRDKFSPISPSLPISPHTHIHKNYSTQFWLLKWYPTRSWVSTFTLGDGIGYYHHTKFCI